MADDTRTEKLRQVVGLLAGENCGQCGYENCGKFAVALVDGKTTPVECRKSLGNVNEICQVLGIEVPEEAALPSGGYGRSRVGGGHGDHGHGHHGHGHHHGHGGHGRGGNHHAGRHHFRF